MDVLELVEADLETSRSAALINEDMVAAIIDAFRVYHNHNATHAEQKEAPEEWEGFRVGDLVTHLTDHGDEAGVYRIEELENRDGERCVVYSDGYDDLESILYATMREIVKLYGPLNTD